MDQSIAPAAEKQPLQPMRPRMPPQNLNAERVCSIVIRIVRAHFSDYFGIDAEDVTPETPLSPDLDTLDITDIINQIEQAIGAHGIGSPTTVAELIIAAWNTHLAKEITASLSAIAEADRGAR